MESIYLSIQQKETGKRIKELLHDNGYTVKDIQEIMGFENPQAVYKWLSGKSLPSLDNFLILSKVLHTSIEDILVVDGDIAVLREGDTRMKNVWEEMQAGNFKERYKEIIDLFKPTEGLTVSVGSMFADLMKQVECVG